MKRDEILDAEDHISPLALQRTSLKLIDPGAVLIVVRGMILAHSFPSAINARAVTINQDMKALRCTADLEPRFLQEFFKGSQRNIVSFADASAHGTRKLETETLGRFEIPLPPLIEQRAIVEVIKRQMAKIDTLREAMEQAMSLLKERSAALIAAAFTGQLAIDGRDAGSFSDHH